MNTQDDTKDALDGMSDHMRRQIAGDKSKTEIFNDIISGYETLLELVRKRGRLDLAQSYLDRVEAHERYKEMADITSGVFDLLEKSDKNTKRASQNVEARDFAIKQLRDTFATAVAHKPQPPNSSPKFSTASNAYITENMESWGDEEVRAYRNTVRRFIEICGDKPVRTYTGADAGKFKDMMSQLHATVGKSSRDRRKVKELIAYADKIDPQRKKRLTPKTMHNHFGRMSAIWRSQLRYDYVERNIFSDWKLGSKKPTVSRLSWTGEHLRKLVENPLGIKTTYGRDTFAYVIAVGSYTGMRLEEICRLRVQDIQSIHGIDCINVQEHQAREGAPWEAWDPKTEAGARLVPVGHGLAQTGFMEFVERVRDAGHYYLFHDLHFSGKRDKAKKRSARIGANFSAFKIKLGVPPSHVFHSFRHNVSTILRNRPLYGDEGIREEWIDDFIGHEGMNKSVGNTTYKDQTFLINLKKTADAVTYPEFWDVRRISISGQ